MGKAFSAASRLLAPLGQLLDHWRHAPVSSHRAPCDARLADGPSAPVPGVLAVDHHRPPSRLQADTPPTAAQPQADWDEPASAPGAGPQPPEGTLMGGGQGTAPALTLPRPTHATSQARPLRVLRIREQRQSSRHAGRLVISGRMADVCAELERLANAHPGLLH